MLPSSEVRLFSDCSDFELISNAKPSPTTSLFTAVTARNIRRKGLLRDCIENEVYDDARYQNLDGGVDADFVDDYPPTYGAASYDNKSGFERAMSYGSSSFRGGLGQPKKGERFDV